MSNKIDSVFKNKLENYQVRPPVDAWASIERDLGKQNDRKLPILKIAASLILISVSTLVAYYLVNSPEKDAISSNPIVKEEPKVIEEQSAEISTTSETEEANESIASTSSHQDKEVRIIFKDLNTIQPLAYEHDVKTTSQVVLRKVAVANTPIRIPSYEEESLPAVTISYRPGDKMLNDDATSEPEKESTLRKAWDYALSVKNGEERPFNIKEMKNELFASNFKKKRSKTQD